jgi:predicted dehydrogenase
MISAAIIGCGRIGFSLEEDPLRKKPCTHFGGMTHAGIRIRSACDIDRDRLMRFGKVSGLSDKSLFTDYHVLLKESPDVVVVATWTQTHSPITIAAAEAGAKVIVCEKPVSGDIKEAKRMRDACAAHGTTLVINHERRYDGRYRKVKELIDKKVIGELRSIRGTLAARGLSSCSDPALGGGPLLHDGTHLVDMIAFLAGKIATIDGRVFRYGKDSGYEDLAVAQLMTNRGIPASIQVGGNTRYFGFGLEIFGSSGKIEIGNGYQRLFISRKSRLYRGFQDLAETKFPSYAKTPCFTELYREVRRIAQNESIRPSSTGEDGLDALKTIHGIYLSAMEKKEINPPEKPINIRAFLTHRF